VVINVLAHPPTHAEHEKTTGVFSYSASVLHHCRTPNTNDTSVGVRSCSVYVLHPPMHSEQYLLLSGERFSLAVKSFWHHASMLSSNIYYRYYIYIN
jgi:hypothetical protein